MRPRRRSGCDLVDELRHPVRADVSLLQPPQIVVGPAGQVLACVQEHREDQQVVPVDEAGIGEPSGEFGTAVEEDAAAFAALELGHLVAGAQDRSLAPAVVQSVLAEGRRHHVFRQIRVRGVVSGVAPDGSERLVVATAEHQCPSPSLRCDGPPVGFPVSPPAVLHAKTSATTSATARTGSLGSGEVRTMISRPPASATGWSSTSSPPKDIMIGLARVSPSPVPARARATAVSVTICVSFAVIPSAEVARRIARPKRSSAGGRIQSASASCPARGSADPAGTTIPKSSSATARQLTPRIAGSGMAG